MRHDKSSTPVSLQEVPEDAPLPHLPSRRLWLWHLTEHPGHSRQDFLRTAIMQSHEYAKYLRICANFGLMIVKQEKLVLIADLQISKSPIGLTKKSGEAL